MKTHELIDRYVYEVGRHLPRKIRADVQMELRGALEDAVEERRGAADGESVDEVVSAILREWGDPQAIAARYYPEQALIGGRLFPMYRFILTTVLLLIAGAHLLGFLVMLLQNRVSEPAEMLLNLFLSYGEIALINIGVTTLIFAAIERSISKEEMQKSQTGPTWDPSHLSAISDSDIINRNEMISAIISAGLGIVAFNFFYEWIGFIDISGEERGIIPLLGPAFAVAIPWLTASWAFDALVKVIVLAQGRWHRMTRWLDVGSQLFGLYVLYRIFQIEQITTVPLFAGLVHWLVGLLMVIVAVDIVRKSWRLWGRSWRTNTPFSPTQSSAI